MPGAFTGQVGVAVVVEVLAQLFNGLREFLEVGLELVESGVDYGDEPKGVAPGGHRQAEPSCRFDEVSECAVDIASATYGPGFEDQADAIAVPAVQRQLHHHGVLLGDGDDTVHDPYR